MLTAIALSLLCISSPAKAQEAGKAEQTVYTKAQTDSLKRVFDEQVAQYNENIHSEPYMALEFAAQARQTAEAMHDSLNIAMAYRNLGKGYFTTRIYYLAMEMQFNAYEIYARYNAKEDIAQCFVDIAKIYNSQEVYHMAEEYCLKAIELCKENNLPEVLAQAILTLGRVEVINDDEQAIPNMRRAKMIYDSLGQQEESVSINVHMAYAYLAQQQPDSSLLLLNSSLDFYAGNNDPKILRDLSFAYLALAETSEMKGDFNKALTYYKKTIESFYKIRYTHYALVAQMRLAQMLFENGDFDSAINNAERVLQQAQIEEVLHGTEEIVLKHRACGVLYKANNKMGNSEQALKYCERFAATGDSVFLLKRQEQFSEFQVSMESQRLQKEIEMLQVNAEKDRLLIAKKSYGRNVFMLVVIIILVIVLGIIFWFRYKEKTRHNDALSSANQKMEKEIQDRKLAEIELKNSEEKYRLLFRKTPIGIIQFSDKFIVTTVNERFIQIFGLKNKNIIGQNITTILPEKIFKDFNSKDSDDADSVIKQELDIKTADCDVSVAFTLKSYYYNTGSDVEKGGIMIVQDITDRKNAERNADGINVSAANTLNMLPDAIFRLDSKANYIFCKIPNASEAQHKKYLGKNLREVITSELLLPFLVAFNNVRKYKEVQYVDYQANEGAENEPPIYNEARFSLCDDGTVFVLIRDITRLKHAESKLKSERTSAEEGSIAKSEFIIGMSSEIREPLQNILRQSEQLVIDIKDPEAALKMKDVLNSAAYVNETLLDMLKLHEMETGNKSFFTKLVNPISIASDVFDIFKARAEEKQLQYQLDYDSFVPTKLELDEVRLRQILFNLISNAIKFTDSGKVLVNITARPSIEHKINLVFSVMDTGSGISKQKIDEMFASDNSDISKKKGMAISKKMADSMKASISVRSTEGEGSIFTVTIPDLVTDADISEIQHEIELNTKKLTQDPDKVISTTRKRNTDAMREYISVLKYAVLPEYKLLKTNMSFEELSLFVSRFREQSVNYHVDKAIEMAEELTKNIKNYDISSITMNIRKLETYIQSLTREIE